MAAVRLTFFFSLSLEPVFFLAAFPSESKLVLSASVESSAGGSMASDTFNIAVVDARFSFPDVSLVPAAAGVPVPALSLTGDPARDEVVERHPLRADEVEVLRVRFPATKEAATAAAKADGLSAADAAEATAASSKRSGGGGIASAAPGLSKVDPLSGNGAISAICFFFLGFFTKLADGKLPATASKIGSVWSVKLVDSEEEKSARSGKLADSGVISAGGGADVEFSRGIAIGDERTEAKVGACSGSCTGEYDTPALSADKSNASASLTGSDI
jgi:hypothetical protein